MRINNPSEIVDTFTSIAQLECTLIDRGCQACSLGFQPEINGCCVSRGIPDTRRMIIGEAPGKHEDSQSQSFVGPAGKLLDKIWTSVGWDTNDWYITNVCLCRPYMPRGSGKENYTPKAEQIKTCRPYLLKQIELIEPDIIVTLGRTATEAIMGPIKSMGSIRGRAQWIKISHNYIYRDYLTFPMIHPAAILRDPNGPYKQQTWEDIQKLKEIVDGIQN